MNYQMCKNCGLANAPTAQACVRCNLRLDAPVYQAQQPPKTAETFGGQANYASAPPKKDSSNMYLIFGGLAALVLVGGLFIGALVIGYFVYSAKTNVTRVENNGKTRTPYPANSSSTPSDNRNNSNGTVFGDEELEAVFSVKKQVGKFTHLLTMPRKPDTKTFQDSGGEATAMYIGKNKGENIIYTIASYPSSEKAQSEFKNYIEQEKRKGGKMLAEVITDNQNKSINASYKTGALTILTFCSWKMDTVTLCHRIGAPEGATVIDFHNSWFNVK